MNAHLALPLTTADAAHLAALLRQFVDLLDDGERAISASDPALARLTPDPYPDDPDAARQFRALTRSDLLSRRREDAQRMLASLDRAGVASLDPAALEDPGPDLAFSLAPDDVQAWLRTLAAVRLVLATRLGIVGEDAHRPDDPRYAVYDWLSFLLDRLVHALD